MQRTILWHKEHPGYRIGLNKKWKMRKFGWINNLKRTNGCYYCKENDPICLDLHHIDPKTKLFSIGKSYSGKTTDEIVLEIEKCACICSNCHRKLHASMLPKPVRTLRRLQILEFLAAA